MNPHQEIEEEKKFKQFDIISGNGASVDHYYASSSSSNNTRNQSLTKRIMREWKILEKNLPESIFVRVYEENIDLLRAVIVGASGTPYHNGLFFFDFHFPSDYPLKPPQVRYHSHGIHLNPNLYPSGYICLSLLNTWFGSEDEKWVQSKSTILQILVSIQGLVLNEEPYFNEPGLFLLTAKMKYQKSLVYNERVFFLTCNSMLNVISRPPNHFKDFVSQHFHERSASILLDCKAYINGNGNGSSSSSSSIVTQKKKACQKIKRSMEEIYPKLVEAFLKNGCSVGNFIKQFEVYEEEEEKENVSSKPKEEIVIKRCGFPNFGKIKEILGLKKVAKV